MISKLTKKLYKTYYASGHKPFLLNIDLDTITVDDIKKQAGKEDVTLLNKITQKKWKLLNKRRMLFKVYDDEHNYNIQLREVKDKTKDLYNSNNKTKLVKYVFSGIAGVKNVNTTELPIMNIDFDKLPKSLIEKVKSYKVDVDPTKKYSIEITEHFFKMVSLDEYLKNNNNLSDLKQILFYIIYTLICYRHIYPKFEHNNLTAKNIMVYCVEKDENSYKEINVDGVLYLVPNTGCEVKISCFEKCNIEGTSSIAKDVSMLAKSLEKYETPRLKEFFKKIGEYSSYKEIIYDSFFDEYKKPTKVTDDVPTEVEKQELKQIVELDNVEELSDISLVSGGSESDEYREGSNSDYLDDTDSDVKDSGFLDKEDEEEEEEEIEEEEIEEMQELSSESSSSFELEKSNNEDNNDSSESLELQDITKELTDSEDEDTEEFPKAVKVDENTSDSLSEDSTTAFPKKKDSIEIDENSEDSESESEDESDTDLFMAGNTTKESKNNKPKDSESKDSDSKDSESEDSDSKDSDSKDSDSEDSDSEDSESAWLSVTETEVEPLRKGNTEQPSNLSGFNRFAQILGGEQLLNKGSENNLLSGNQLLNYTNQQFGNPHMPQMNYQQVQNFKQTKVPNAQNLNIGYSNMNQTGGNRNDDFFF